LKVYGVVLVVQEWVGCAGGSALARASPVSASAVKCHCYAYKAGELSSDRRGYMPRAFVREIGSLIRYNAKLTAIKRDDKHVTVTYEDARTGGAPMTATADWCLCIPLSVAVINCVRSHFATLTRTAYRRPM
jgi:hypothetical protein